MKSKTINILIIIIALALIIFLVVKNKKGGDTLPTDNIETESMTNEEGNDTTQGYGDEIPAPTEASWGKSTKGNLSFDIPNNYYVSYPTVGECSDIISISTQTPSDPTVAIAMIYKEGCVTQTDVTGIYTRQEVKDGYVFQTNSLNPTIVSIFNRIVATAKVN
ncbi:hypothetical protein IT397_00860 [Candidatus Nomurabacteria bacterium]|nr:hypothetical protein [Candidatus Nomurabacteria bacterium]